MKFRHVNIISSNWKELANFYVKTFDCKIVPPIRKQTGKWLEDGTGVKGAQLEGAHLALPGFEKDGPTLEIYQYSEVKALKNISANTRGYGHIAFEVDDLKKTVESVLENGGELEGQISSRKIMGVGIITFVYTRDPDGNLIELQRWQPL